MTPNVKYRVVAYELVKQEMEGMDSLSILGVQLKMFPGIDCERWAICCGSDVMTTKGEWEYQRLPSARTEAFYKRCRFKTPEEAVKAWEKYNDTQR